MSKPYLPGANHEAQWFGDSYPGSPINANCGVIHTTETNDWPGYGGGASAPNLTVKPNCRRKKLNVRQHLRMDRSARALQNDSGGVETNTLNCIQIELVGCCDPGIERVWRSWGLKRNVDYIFWPKAPRWARRELGRLVARISRRYGIKLVGPDNSQWRQTGSWGESAPQRFSFAQWRAFYGWCGHQHVPENDHWDPGGINFDSIMGYARRFDEGSGGKEPAEEPEPTRQPNDGRDRPSPRERAREHLGNRVQTGRAWLRWASNRAAKHGHPGRARRIRRALRKYLPNR